MKILQTPLTRDCIKELLAGDIVQLSGTIFTARDAAHKRFATAISEHKKLPIDLRGQILYYTGPSPAPPGKVIGSAGPTTSSRMDKYTPDLLAATGLLAMIGKGDRNQAVIDAIINNCCVYFAAVGGAGALLSQHIVQAKVVCYPELGPEAVHQLTVHNFPLIVAIDSRGNNCYKDGPSAYRLSQRI